MFVYVHLWASAVIYRTVKGCMKAEVTGRGPGQTDAAVYNKVYEISSCHMSQESL